MDLCSRLEADSYNEKHCVLNECCGRCWHSMDLHGGIEMD